GPTGQGAVGRVGQGRVELVGVPAAVLVDHGMGAMTGDVGRVECVASQDVVHALEHGVPVAFGAGEVVGPRHDHQVVEDEVVGTPGEHPVARCVGQPVGVLLDVGQVLIGALHDGCPGLLR